MAYTLSTFRTLLAYYLMRADITDAMLTSFIQIAQRKIERENWKCMKATGTASFTSTVDYFAEPTRYKESIALFITVNGVQYRLVKDTYENMISAWPYGSTRTGVPKVFAFDDANSKIYVRPYPDGTYVYVHNYYALTAEMTADANHNFWTDTAWEVLLYGSLLEATPYIMGDTRLATWNQYYQDAKNTLRDMETSEEFAGSHQAIKSDYGDVVVARKIGDYAV